MDLLVIVGGMLLFALLSRLFGADSSERWDSSEWERRQWWLERRSSDDSNIEPFE